MAGSDQQRRDQFTVQHRFSLDSPCGVNQSIKMRYHVNTSGFGRQLSVQLISIITFSRLGQKNAVFKVTGPSRTQKRPAMADRAASPDPPSALSFRSRGRY